MKIRTRRKLTVAATTIVRPPRFAVRHILALIRIFVIMGSKCNETIAILASNAALGAVLTVNVPTLFCVMKSAQPISIAHLLVDAVATAIAHKRLSAKEIRLQEIIAINRVNASQDTVIWSQLVKNQSNLTDVKSTRTNLRIKVRCGPSYQASSSCFF